MSRKRQEAESGEVATVAHAAAISYSDVQQRIVCIRDTSVIIDVDVAALYGVETKHVNQAVRNNRDKIPADYVFELTSGEVEDLRSKVLTTKLSSKSRVAPKAFTEKGLYMLATILKSKRATAATFAIIEKFAKVRGLNRELVELSTCAKISQVQVEGGQDGCRNHPRTSRLNPQSNNGTTRIRQAA